MTRNQTKILFFLLTGFLFIAGLSACSLNSAPEPTPVTVEVTRVVQETVLVTQVVEVEKVITATPEPTSQSAVPAAVSSEAAPAAASQGAELAGWCLPKNLDPATQGIQDAGAMPEGANPLQDVNGKKDVVIEVQNCTFVYTFPAPPAKGTRLQLYDTGKSPFLTVDLTATTQSPAKAYATISHPFVVNPPFWQIPYRLEVVGADGKVIRSDEVIFKRGWTPVGCYDGSWPDPVTLKCKFMGEAHPWDPWYGKENPYEPTPEGG